MFALHKAFEQSTKSVQDAARAERQRRGEMSRQASQSSASSIASSSPPSFYSAAADQSASYIGHQRLLSSPSRPAGAYNQQARPGSYQSSTDRPSIPRSLSSTSGSLAPSNVASARTSYPSQSARTSLLAAAQDDDAQDQRAVEDALPEQSIEATPRALDAKKSLPPLPPAPSEETRLTPPAALDDGPSPKQSPQLAPDVARPAKSDKRPSAQTSPSLQTKKSNGWLSRSSPSDWQVPEGDLKAQHPGWSPTSTPIAAVLPLPDAPASRAPRKKSSRTSSTAEGSSLTAPRSEQSLSSTLTPARKIKNSLGLGSGRSVQSGASSPSVYSSHSGSLEQNRPSTSSVLPSAPSPSSRDGTANGNRSGGSHLRLSSMGTFDPFGTSSQSGSPHIDKRSVSPTTMYPQEHESYRSPSSDNSRARGASGQTAASRPSSTLERPAQAPTTADSIPQQRPGRLARLFSKQRIRSGVEDSPISSVGTFGSRAPSIDHTGQARQSSGSGGSGELPGSSAQRPETASSSNSGSRRPSTSLSHHMDNSKLESSGGAAALFGGGGNGTKSGGSNRPKTSALKQGLSLFTGSNSRSRTASGSSDVPSTMRKGNPTTNNVGMRSTSALSPAMTDVPEASEALEAGGDGQSKPATKDPKPSSFPPLVNESPQAYADRLEGQVDRSDIATILANSGDAFFQDALHCHMRRFLFAGNALDIALRKTLMELCLPKETQQIDRVMEAFAKRYQECNEGLFASDDQPYILAFSLIMLHTDAFNKNAKNKMSKADYVKNTASSRVPVDVLEYLYDNLTFTPFVYSNETDAKNGQGITSAAAPSLAAGNTATSNFLTPSKDKPGKIDAYLLLKQGRLGQFHPNIEHLIPEDDPYSYTGSLERLHVGGLVRAYAASPSIEIALARRPSATSMGSGALSGSNGNPWTGPEMAGAAPLSSDPNEMDQSGTVTLRVFKVGIINRKDDVIDKGKRQSRKWKSCGMILSSSQLLFFRDLVWIDALHSQLGDQLAATDPEERKRGIVISPKITNFKPDGVLSLGDAVAVMDGSYEKHRNVLRLVGVQGRVQSEYLFQARNEGDMNEWIAGINFCACFRAAGLKVTNRDAFTLNSTRRGNLSQSPSSTGATSRGMLPSPSTGMLVSEEWLERQIASRRRELVPKLADASRSLAEHAAELGELLRLARHFSIMTPFQRTTRERIEAAAVPLAARIRQLRILVAKWECRQVIMTTELQEANQALGSDGMIDFSPSLAVSTPNLLSMRNNSYFAVESEHGDAGPIFDEDYRRARTTSTSLSPHDVPAIPLLGSFASQAALHDDYQAGAPSIAGSSKSLKMKISRPRQSEGRRDSEYSEPPDIAESWQSTRAFRDPDRISLAQLPSISMDQIEAVTKEKVRRRQMGSTSTQGSSISATGLDLSAVRSGSFAFSGTSVSGSQRRLASSTSARSGISSSGDRSTSAREQPYDPPVFLPVWGL